MQGGDTMKSNFFSGNESPSQADGKSMLEQAAQRDPRISGLLSKLSDTDRAQLMKVLNDPAQAKSILATPQAQAIMRTLSQNSNTGRKKGPDGD